MKIERDSILYRILLKQMSDSILKEGQYHVQSSSAMLSSMQNNISRNEQQKPLWGSHHETQVNMQPIYNVEEQHELLQNHRKNNDQVIKVKDKNHDGRNKIKVFGAKQQFAAYTAFVNDGLEQKLEAKGTQELAEKAKLVQKTNLLNTNSQFIITNHQLHQPLCQQPHNQLTDANLQPQNQSLSHKKRIIGSRRNVSPHFTVIQPNSIGTKETPISRQSTKFVPFVQPEVGHQHLNKEESVETKGDTRNGKSRPKVIGKQTKVSALFDTIEGEGQAQIISKVHNDKKIRISKSHFQQQRKQGIASGEKEQIQNSKDGMVNEQKQMANQPSKTVQLSQTKQELVRSDMKKTSSKQDQQKQQNRKAENEEMKGNNNEIVNNQIGESNLTVQSCEQSIHRKQKSRPKVFGSQVKVPARFDEICSTQSKNQSSVYPNNKSQKVNPVISNPKIASLATLPIAEPKQEQNHEQCIPSQAKPVSSGSQKQIRTVRSSKKLTAKIDTIENKSSPKVEHSKDIPQNVQGSKLAQKVEHQQKEDDNKRKASSVGKSQTRKMFGSKAALSAYMVDLGAGEDKGERVNVTKKVTLLMKSGKKLTAKIEQIEQDAQNDKCQFILEEEKVSKSKIEQHKAEIQQEQKPHQKIQQQDQIQGQKEQQIGAPQVPQEQSQIAKQSEEQESIHYPQENQDQIVEEQTEKQPSIKIIQSEELKTENKSQKNLPNEKSKKVIGSKSNISAYVQEISPKEEESKDKEGSVKEDEEKVQQAKSQKHSDHTPEQVFVKEQNEANIENKLVPTSDQAQQHGQDLKQEMRQSELQNVHQKCSYDQTLVHCEDKNKTPNEASENVKNDDEPVQNKEEQREIKGEEACFLLEEKGYSEEMQANKKDSLKQERQQMPSANEVIQKSYENTSAKNIDGKDAEEDIKLQNKLTNEQKLEQQNTKNQASPPKNHPDQISQSVTHHKQPQQVSSHSQILKVSNDPKIQTQNLQVCQQPIKDEEKQLHENVINKSQKSIGSKKGDKKGSEVDHQKQTLVEKQIQKPNESQIVNSAKFILSEDKDQPTQNQTEIIKQDTLELKQEKKSQKEIKLQSSIVFVEENNTPQTPQTPRPSKKKVPSSSQIKSSQIKVNEKNQKESPKKQKQIENKFVVKSRSDKRISSKVISEKEIHKGDSESIEFNILKQNAKANTTKGENVIQNKIQRGLTSQAKQSVQKEVESHKWNEPSKQLLKKGLYVDLLPISSKQTDKVKNIKQNSKKSVTQTNKTKPQQLALPKKGPLSEPKGSLKSLSKKQSSESDKFSVEKKSLKKIGSNKSIEIKNQQIQETVKYPQIGKSNNESNKAGQIKKIGYSKFKESLNRKDTNKQNNGIHNVSQKQKANHQKVQADQYESYLIEKQQSESQKSPKSPFRIVQKSPIKKKNFSSPYLEPVFRKLNMHSLKKGHGRVTRNHELEDIGERSHNQNEMGHHDNQKGLKKQSIAQRNKNMGFNERQVEKLKDEYEKLRNMEEQYARQKRRTKTSSKKKHRKLEYFNQRNEKMESDEDEEQRAKGYKYLKAHSHQFSYLYPSTELNQTGQKLNKRLGELDKKLKRDRYSLERKNKQNGDVHEYIAFARKQHKNELLIDH